MAVTVVVEDGTGLANANSYVSVAATDTYFEGRLNSTSWTGATSGNKDIAVVMATRILDDYFEWVGQKVSKEQALEFPRFGVYDRGGYLIPSEELPTELAEATSEMALWLLASDRLAEDDTRGFTELKVGSLMMKVDKEDRTSTIPQIVSRMLSALGVVRASGMAKAIR